jgi:hypothetical protein
MRDARAARAGARKNTDAEDDAFRVIEKPLFRHKSRSVTLAETPPPPKPEPVRRPAKVAQQLALAHHLQAAIDRGAVADRAAVARKLGLTRARVTQLLDLCSWRPISKTPSWPSKPSTAPSRWPSGPSGRWPTPGRGPSSGRRGHQEDLARAAAPRLRPLSGRAGSA